MIFSKEKLKKIIDLHALWLADNDKGKRADLRGADLSCVNFRGIDLSYADLRCADLSYANFDGANLRGADLRGVDLSCVNLPLDLQNLYSLDILLKIKQIVLNNETDIEMSKWHTCDTVHCIAGWAIYLHPRGAEIAKKTSEHFAGRLILGEKTSKHFFDTNKQAISWLKSV